jgi:hypothetical protein
MGKPRHGQRGNLGYTAFSKHPETHWGANVGTTPFLNIVAALLYPQPGRFTAGSRADVASYRQLIDNDRISAWRLILEPGQSAGPITQSAPGMRIVVDGGEISESAPGAADRAWGLRSGEFFWQDPGATRAVKNIGTTPINVVELELK